MTYVDGDEVCAYRGDDGKQCAAGCLIPDSEYDHTYEGCSVVSVSFFDRWPETAVALVVELQATHDNKAPFDWERNFKKLASMFDLTYTPVSEVSP